MRCSSSSRPKREKRLQPIDRVTPLGRLRRADAVLVAEHADLVDRRIEADGGDPFDGDELFAAVEIVDELPVVAGRQDVRRHMHSWTRH